MWARFLPHICFICQTWFFANLFGCDVTSASCQTCQTCYFYPQVGGLIPWYLLPLGPPERVEILRESRALSTTSYLFWCRSNGDFFATVVSQTTVQRSSGHQTKLSNCWFVQRQWSFSCWTSACQIDGCGLPSNQDGSRRSPNAGVHSFFTTVVGLFPNHCVARFCVDRKNGEINW